MEHERQWIKNLAHYEDRMESLGQAESSSASLASDEELEEHTVEFLRQIRTAFTQNVSFFNQIKGYVGGIRIYGITDTKGDFMLFRNGYKLVFLMKQPGLIAVRFSHSESLLPGQEGKSHPLDFIKGEWRAYGELEWTNNNQPLRIDYLIRYYMTRFVKQSIR